MYYYNVVDDVVVKRSFRYRKMCTDEELAKQIAEKKPDSKVMYLLNMRKKQLHATG